MTVAQYFTSDIATQHDLDGFYPRVIGAFEEVALLTTSDTVPLHDILRLVGRRLCELLEVTRCSVYLRRTDGRFQGQVGYCVGRSIDERVSKLVSGVEADRFTAEIVASQSPVVVEDAVSDPRTIHRTMRQWGVRDMLGVPLVVDHEVIGIIYVDNQGRRRGYTSQDIKVAQAFAGLSALAVRQGWLYSQLAERANVIDHQRRVLGETTVVHNRVTRAVLDGATTEAILQLIAELLGKPVVLYSPKFKVVSWAAHPDSQMHQCPALTTEQLGLEWIRKQMASLHNGSPSITLRATTETRCRRLLVRMAVGQQCVGYLEMCEIGGKFTAVDAKALEQASMAIALKRLTDQRNEDLSRQEREEYFADILYGRRDIASLTGRAERFGIDLDKRHAVVRLQYAYEGCASDSTGHRRRHGVTATLNRFLAGAGQVLAGTSVPGADLFLLSAPVAEAGQVDGALGSALQAAFPEVAARYDVQFAVVSETCRTLHDLPAAAERVRDTVNLLRETGREPQLAFAYQFELIRLVARRDGIPAALRHATGLLRPLVDHDEANEGALLPTLEAFTRCQAQIRTTAAELGVHENTVRYRLNRIREISTIDPMRLDSLMGVSMALQLHSLFGDGRSANSVDFDNSLNERTRQDHRAPALLTG
jgi:sugar diacid utilization regulator